MSLPKLTLYRISALFFLAVSISIFSATVLAVSELQLPSGDSKKRPDQPLKAKAPIRFYFFGGGGSRSKAENIFDPGFLELEKLTANRKWEATFQVDTGHPSTQRNLKALPAATQEKIFDFSSNSFLNQMTDIRKKIDSGYFSKDQKILVVIATHGSGLNEDGINEISTSDSTKTPLSPSLKNLVEAANRKGIKLGLILDHCYSGDQIKDFQKSSNVCIVTASESSRMGSTEFDHFFRELSNAQDLESAFLTSRANMLNSAPQPMINTEAGLKAARDLEIIKNFKFGIADSKDAHANRLCSNNKYKLEKLVKVMSEINEQSQRDWFATWTNSHRDIAEDIKKYFLANEQELNQAAEKPQGPHGRDSSECIAKTRNLNQGKFGFCFYVFRSLSQELQLVKDQIAILRKENMQVSPKGSRREEMESKYNIKMPTEGLKIGDLEFELGRLMKFYQDPEFIEADRKMSAFRAKQKKWQLEADKAHEKAWGGEMMQNERLMYDALYKHYSKQSPASNPCRDFKLK